MQSEKWTLNAEERAKWLKNATLFLAPVAVIYLSSVVEPLQDGFAWSDFALSPMVAGAISLYVVNVLLDFFRKFSASQ